MNLSSTATKVSVETVGGYLTHSEIRAGGTTSAFPSWSDVYSTNKVVCNVSEENLTMNTNTKWKVINYTVSNNIYYWTGTNSWDHRYKTEDYFDFRLFVFLADKNGTSHMKLMNGMHLPSPSTVNLITADNPVWLRYDHSSSQASQIGFHIDEGLGPDPAIQATTRDMSGISWYCTYEIWGDV